MGRKHLARDMARAGATDRRPGTPARRAPARTWPPKLHDTILAYPTMAAGPGSLFSDVSSYRQCEGAMADLTCKVAIVTGASKALAVAIAKALARTGPPLQSIVPREGRSGTKVTRRI